MRKDEVASWIDAQARDEEHSANQGPSKRFTPFQFFQELGMVLLICLGLMLLSDVIVAMVGAG